MENVIRDIGLAAAGKKKIEWAGNFMPVLNEIKAEFEKYKPFKGIKVAVSIHLEAKTAYLALTLQSGGLMYIFPAATPFLPRMMLRLH